MRARGHTSIRNARSGVDVGPLARAAGVSREMARRYPEGVVPDLNKLEKIADWLGVRLAWLRDGEGPMRAAAHAADSAGAGYMPDEAREIANIWLKLPAARRAAFRASMAMEAMLLTHYPWLTFGHPEGESYRDYERRVERDIMRIAARLTKPRP